MFRALAILLASLTFIGTAHAATAQSSDLPLTLLRAVRLSTTTITLSYKTEEDTTGKIRYSQPGGSEIQLTDSVPQTDHLFTITELDPNHGYSFVLSASTDTKQSNEYVILIAPSSIGAPGQSIVPGVQVTSSDGSVVAATIAASTTPFDPGPTVPWWAFVVLFVLVVGGWIGYSAYKRKHAPKLPVYPS